MKKKIINGLIVGIAAIASYIGGKVIYDQYKENKTTNNDENIVPTYKIRKYDEDGYDIETHKDRNGYYKNGYNDLGLDRSNRDKLFYIEEYKKIDSERKKARILNKNGEIENALFHYGKIFENLLKYISYHLFGNNFKDKTTYAFLMKISSKNIMDKSLIDNLHEVRKYFNENKHELSDKSFEKVKDFIIKTTDKLYYVTKEILDI